MFCSVFVFLPASMFTQRVNYSHCSSCYQIRNWFTTHLTFEESTHSGVLHNNVLQLACATSNTMGEKAGTTLSHCLQFDVVLVYFLREMGSSFILCLFIQTVSCNTETKDGTRTSAYLLLFSTVAR